MAEPSEKHEDNVPGKFYVDKNCDACQVCISVAPENFKMNDDDEYAYVVKQPESPDEESDCREAIDGCPEEAVGDDGDKDE